MVKNLPANAGDVRDVGLIPGSGRSPAEGNGYPLQYSCLENPTDRGAWRATVPGVAKSQTRLSDSAHTGMICVPRPGTEHEPLQQKLQALTLDCQGGPQKRLSAKSNRK